MNKAISAVFVFCLFKTLSFAALPDIITDPNTREVVEYLDAKIQNSSTTASSVSISSQSVPLTIVSDGVAYMDHGLGATPSLFTVTMKNITPEFSYTTGDEVLVGYGATTGCGSLIANATRVTFNLDNGCGIVSADSPHALVTLTLASWKVIIRAWK